MMNITRWDPFRELSALRRAMDRDFDESLGLGPNWNEGQEMSLALDVAENEDGYVIKASVAGVDPEALEITLNDNLLTIKGEIASDREIDEKNYHLRERRIGRFARSLSLPTAVESDKVEATTDNGVLTLRLPKAEAAKPKKIAIKQTV